MAKLELNGNLYRYHVENLRSLELALDKTALSARQAISQENHRSTTSFVRLYAFLIGAWAETRLRKLLLENSGFSADERKGVLAKSTQLGQWKKALETAFRKHYRVPRAELRPPALPHSAYSRYVTLEQLIAERLGPVIAVRNKLAHGQWIFPLNNEGTAVEPDKYVLINKETLPSLQYKFSALKTLAEILHDLVVSPGTFERDFDRHFAHIASTIANLENRAYESYARGLVQKRRRGREKRKTGKKP